MKEKLLAPLGMNETTFTPGVSLVRRHPRFAAQAEGKSDDEVATQIESLRAQRGPFVNTAGALVSSPDDLQRFLQFHANKGRVGKRQIAPASVLAKLYRKQPATRDYGMGFNLRGGSVVGHGEQPEHSLASTSRPAVFLSSLPKRAFQTLVRSRRALPKSFSLKN